LITTAALAIAPSLAFSAESVPAATVPDAQNQTTPPAENVVIVGSRFGGRIVADSPVPVDYLPLTLLDQGGYTGLTQKLKAAVPSFSTPHPSTAASLDFTTVPTLRGLSPGQLLLLVNGKRRHSSGDLGTGVQIGRGDVTYDLNTIPTAAIGHVEILRDSASAQYGADAIAGVINIVLDNTPGMGGNVMYGGYTAGDGRAVDADAYMGVPLGASGIVRVTVSFQDHGETDRSALDTRQQYFGSNGTTAISNNFGSGVGLTPSNGTLDPREATIDRHTFRLGDSPYQSKAVFVNGELPLSGVTAYGFGGYSVLDGTSFGFFRRAGQDETVRALFPDGYLPNVDVKMQNWSIAGGVRGEGLAGFTWDLSTVYGDSIIDFTQSNSNNPSLGAASPTSSYRGGTRFAQWTTNFDLSREFDVGDGSPLRLAFGYEHRAEYYDLVEGDAASYANGGVPIIGGPNNGKPAPVGFQPTAGNRPIDAVSVSRNSNALYAEVEKEFFDRLLVSGSLRWEDYSDFGSNTTYKVATRYRLLDSLAVRASVGSGFRAPHLAQSYFSNTSVNFLNGLPVFVRLLPVSDPSAILLGAKPLKPEKSLSESAGLVFDRGNFLFSVDAYHIDIDDRIAISSTFQDVRVTNLLAAAGNSGIGGASYLTNAVDTNTVGVDFTAQYILDLAEKGVLTITGGANYNHTTFDRIAPTPESLLALGITTPLFDLTQQIRFTNSSPRDKYLLGLDWMWNRFHVTLNNIRYGKVESVAFASLTPARIDAVTPGFDIRLAPTDPASANSQVIQSFSAKIITDLELGYQVTDNLTLSVGVNNLFDVYPDKNIASTVASVAAGTNGSDNAGIFPYNYVSPWGWNGRFIYAKAGFRM
jgi:iron complex outermembrane receptor protein